MSRQHVVTGALCAALAAVMATVIATPTRAETDGPDSLLELVDAAAQRLQTADPVAAFKWQANSPIEDPPRVDKVLVDVSTDATRHHVDPGYVTQLFSDQINATDAIEYSRFAEWKLDPAGAPATAPDLSTSRAAIDALDHTMVAEIARHSDVLQSPACAGELDDARRAVAGARQLDELYQRALSFATRSYCQ
jgi:chorismate mutase